MKNKYIEETIKEIKEKVAPVIMARQSILPEAEKDIKQTMSIFKQSLQDCRQQAQDEIVEIIEKKIQKERLSGTPYLEDKIIKLIKEEV